MLLHISSHEIAEWKAYERVAGPLGNAYMDEQVATLNDQLHLLNYLTSQAHFSRNGLEGPVSKPEKLTTRMRELFEQAKKQQAEEENY